MQAKTLCTPARAKKIVVGLTVVSLTVEAVNLASMYLAGILVINHIYDIVFRMVVPATVLVINVMVVREVRRRTSNAAANNLGLQHQHSASSNSAVPTIMLLTTSLVYVLLCGTASVLYVVHQWTHKTSFSFLHQCRMIASALSLLVFAYNFYVYLIIGRQFRSELHKLFCSCFSSSSPTANVDVTISRTGQTSVRFTGGLGD